MAETALDFSPEFETDDSSQNSEKEYEQLERENASLKKEIQGLQDELKQWRQVVQQHEPHCSMLPAPGTALIGKQHVNVTDFLAEDWQKAEVMMY
ncbi:hypothetical protein chiPu_0017689 [Chiloscyllium punctatum]|uniref:Uncharacterized protein n=1 Tax=Chiloscyllium punctatum TaxID=137246 RepID=A0A401RI44_CHIPU|nr:hypothetical protein [Chiloscyllium punctatum]